MTSHIQDLSFDIKIIHLFYRVIMAVLKSLPGIEVAITIDGVALYEYREWAPAELQQCADTKHPRQPLDIS